MACQGDRREGDVEMVSDRHGWHMIDRGGSRRVSRRVEEAGMDVRLQLEGRRMEKYSDL